MGDTDRHTERHRETQPAALSPSVNIMTIVFFLRTTCRRAECGNARKSTEKAFVWEPRRLECHANSSGRGAKRGPVNRGLMKQRGYKCDNDAGTPSGLAGGVTASSRCFAAVKTAREVGMFSRLSDSSAEVVSLITLSLAACPPLCLLLSLYYTLYKHLLFI